MKPDLIIAILYHHGLWFMTCSSCRRQCLVAVERGWSHAAPCRHAAMPPPSTTIRCPPTPPPPSSSAHPSHPPMLAPRALANLRAITITRPRPAKQQQQQQQHLHSHPAIIILLSLTRPHRSSSSIATTTAVAAAASIMDYASIPTPEACYVDFCLIPVRFCEFPAPPFP